MYDQPPSPPSNSSDSSSTMSSGEERPAAVYSTSSTGTTSSSSTSSDSSAEAGGRSPENRMVIQPSGDIRFTRYRVDHLGASGRVVPHYPEMPAVPIKAMHEVVATDVSTGYRRYLEVKAIPWMEHIRMMHPEFHTNMDEFLAQTAPIEPQIKTADPFYDHFIISDCKNRKDYNELLGHAESWTPMHYFILDLFDRKDKRLEHVVETLEQNLYTIKWRNEHMNESNEPFVLGVEIAENDIANIVDRMTKLRDDFRMIDFLGRYLQTLFEAKPHKWLYERMLSDMQKANIVCRVFSYVDLRQGVPH